MPRGGQEAWLALPTFATVSCKLWSTVLESRGRGMYSHSLSEILIKVDSKLFPNTQRAYKNSALVNQRLCGCDIQCSSPKAPT